MFELRIAAVEKDFNFFLRIYTGKENARCASFVAFDAIREILKEFPTLINHSEVFFMKGGIFTARLYTLSLSILITPVHVKDE